MVRAITMETLLTRRHPVKDWSTQPPAYGSVTIDVYGVAFLCKLESIFLFLITFCAVLLVGQHFSITTSLPPWLNCSFQLLILQRQVQTETEILLVYAL